MMKSKLFIPFLVVCPAIFFWLGWPPNGLFFLLFIAFIPLFELEKAMENKKGWKYFLLLYSALFLWNISLTWWVWNASTGGAIVMLIFNSLFMCIPWFLYRVSKKKFGNRAVYLFVIFWLLFEYLHHRWDLSWPWLTLGNGLANAPWLVQWYDITGTLGGSAFVLAMNILIWRAIELRTKKAVLIPVGFLFFVFISSFFDGWKFSKFHDSKQNPINAVAMQPSFDPWNEKFNTDPVVLIQKMTDISATALDSNSDLLVWPETSLVGGLDVDGINSNFQVQILQKFKEKYPKLNILTGADMQRVYRNCKTKPNATARKTDDKTIWWNSYNSALFLGNKGSNAYYHKAYLVPGTEQMPFVSTFPFIEKLALKVDDNSISGSLGKSDSVVVFESGKMKVAPCICYESIYGNYITKFINKGANLIAISTNDAWWNNTPGYRQHLAYGALRAIEERKWIVRSANTGTSCFVDPLGHIIQPTKWYEKTAIKQTVYLNDYRTIYSKLGDLKILLILMGICVFLFIYKGK